jgi:signal transduction histidine kinase
MRHNHRDGDPAATPVWSLSSRLFRYFLSGQMLLMLLVSAVAVVALTVAATDYFKTRLEHDRDLLLKEIHWHEHWIDVDEDILPPIFVEPLSGHYYQVSWQGQELRSPSLDGQRLRVPEVIAKKPGWGWQWLTLDREMTVWQHLWHEMTESAADDQRLYILSQRLKVNGHWITVQIAEDFRPILGMFWQGFWWLLVLLGLVSALMFVGQRYWLRRTLAPFEQVRQQLRALGQQEREALDSPPMRELIPLVNEINRMGERMRERLLRARLASGNLSHALKTPLAILNNRLDELQPEASDTVRLQSLEESRQQLARINFLIDNEMKRARIAGLMSRGARLDLTDMLQQLADGLGKLYPAIHLELQLPAALQYPGEREDMFELFGNLLDNACKWAAGQVVLSAEADASEVRLLIQDDGPGVPPSRLAALAQPGERMDESSQGYGLGLAIVADIVSQYQGDIEFSNTEGAGLRVELRLPRQ